MRAREDIGSRFREPPFYFCDVRRVVRPRAARQMGRVEGPAVRAGRVACVLSFVLFVHSRSLFACVVSLSLSTSRVTYALPLTLNVHTPSHPQPTHSLSPEGTFVVLAFTGKIAPWYA